MKKIAIPAILVGVMLIAVGFAIQPVEKASAVHTTIQATQTTTFVLSQAAAFTAAGAQSSALDCTSDCVITSISARVTAGCAATTDNGGVTQITVDTVARGGAALTGPVNDAVVDSTVAAQDLCVLALASNDSVEFVDSVAFQSNVFAAVAAGTNDMTITVTQVTATTDTYTVTVVVQQQGTTAPTLGAFA